MWYFLKGIFFGALIGAAFGMMADGRTRKRFKRSLPLRAMRSAYEHIEDMM